MNPFSKLLSMFKTSGESSASSGDHVVGIDIGTSSIKLVELRKKGGRAILETYSTLALGPYGKLDVGATTNLSAEILTTAIADAIREGNISTKNSAISIPSSASLVFLIELPASIAERDLSSIVPTEARKYIPVPISEVSLDYWVIPRHEESDGSASAKVEVLVAAIHNETLAKYREIARASGISADVFEIEVFSAIRSTFSHELSAVLLVDVGASKTKLAVVEYGIVRSFHIVNKGSFDITSNISKSLSIPFEKAEDLKRDVGLLGTGENKAVSEVATLTVDYILSETKNAIGNFERKHNKAVSKVILSGAGVLLPGFKGRAEEFLKTETVLGNPFDKVQVPEFVAKVLSETGPEFAIALGLALRKLG